MGYFIYGLWDCLHSVPFYCFFFVMGLLCTYFLQFHMFHIGSSMGMMWVSPIPVPYVDSRVSMRLLCTYYFHKVPHASRPSHIWGMVWDCHIPIQYDCWLFSMILDWKIIMRNLWNTTEVKYSTCTGGSRKSPTAWPPYHASLMHPLIRIILLI